MFPTVRKSCLHYCQGLPQVCFLRVCHCQKSTLWSLALALPAFVSVCRGNPKGRCWENVVLVWYCRCTLPLLPNEDTTSEKLCWYWECRSLSTLFDTNTLPCHSLWAFCKPLRFYKKAKVVWGQIAVPRSNIQVPLRNILSQRRHLLFSRMLLHTFPEPLQSIDSKK